MRPDKATRRSVVPTIMLLLCIPAAATGQQKAKSSRSQTGPLCTMQITAPKDHVKAGDPITNPARAYELEQSRRRVIQPARVP